MHLLCSLALFKVALAQLGGRGSSQVRRLRGSA